MRCGLLRRRSCWIKREIPALDVENHVHSGDLAASALAEKAVHHFPYDVHAE